MSSISKLLLFGAICLIGLGLFWSTKQSTWHDLESDRSADEDSAMQNQVDAESISVRVFVENEPVERDAQGAEPAEGGLHPLIDRHGGEVVRSVPIVEVDPNAPRPWEPKSDDVGASDGQRPQSTGLVGMVSAKSDEGAGDPPPAESGVGKSPESSDPGVQGAPPEGSGSTGAATVHTGLAGSNSGTPGIEGPGPGSESLVVPTVPPEEDTASH